MAPAAEDARSPAMPARAAPWNDEKVRSILFQLVTLGLVVALGAYLAGNAIDNLRRQGIATGFGFLDREASFAINPTLIPYSAADSYARALLAGLLNTLLVAGLGIVLATLLGFVIGIGRLSRNWLISRLSLAYVEVMRNTPLLLLIFVWWDVFRLSAPQPREAWQPLPHVYISNRGLFFPVPVYDTAYGWILLAAAIGLLAAIVLRRWGRRHQARTGKRPPSAWLGLALVVLTPVIAFFALGAPYLLDVPRVTRFDFSGGQSIAFEFAALLSALVTYTAAFIG